MQTKGEQDTGALDSSRFEPNRYEGKPRWLPKNEKRLLQALILAVEDRMALMSDPERIKLLRGCLNVSPINCAWDEYAIAKIIYDRLSHDIANRDSDESPKGGDGEAGSVACDDSAGPKDIAQ